MPATTTLETARAILQKAVKRLPNGPASNTELLDRHIQMAGTEFVDETQTVVSFTSGLALTVDQETLDVSAVTDLEPGRIGFVERVHPTDGTRDMMRQVDYDYFVRIRDHGLSHGYYYELMVPTTEQFEGYPMLYSFRDMDTMVVFPKPEVAWTIRIKYFPHFTSFTAGTGSPAAVTLNIPDHLIHGVMRGAAMYLDQAEPDALLNDPRMAWWRSFIDQHRGDAGLTAPTFTVNASEY